MKPQENRPQMNTDKHRFQICGISSVSICVHLWLISCFSVAHAADLRIIPYPRQVERLDARMPLRGTVTIAVGSGDAEDRFAAGLLKEEIESATKAKVRISNGSIGQI